VDPNLPLSGLKVAADELDVVETVMSIEEELDVEIKDEEIGDTVVEITLPALLPPRRASRLCRPDPCLRHLADEPTVSVVPIIR